MKKIVVIILTFLPSPKLYLGATFNRIGGLGRGPSRGNGDFNYPSGVGVDSDTGAVYVMDQWFQRIQKFDADGNYVMQ